MNPNVGSPKPQVTASAQGHLFLGHRCCPLLKCFFSDPWLRSLAA